jgi:hypothetical protein
VVNALKFKENINFTCSIPNPESPLLDEFSVLGMGVYSQKLMFMNSKVNYQLNIDDDKLQEVKKMYNESEKVYWMFDWKYKRQGWLNCTSPVFFDFGDESLYWLKRRKQGREILYYIHIIKKESFIKKYSN